MSKKISRHFSNETNDYDGMDIEELYVICMNLTEFKYHIYTLKGLMINRVVFTNIVKSYGEPVAVSSNGLNFLFKKSKD